MLQADNEQIADCRQGTARHTTAKQSSCSRRQGLGRGVAGGVADKQEAPEINGQQCELEKFAVSD